MSLFPLAPSMSLFPLAPSMSLFPLARSMSLPSVYLHPPCFTLPLSSIFIFSITGSPRPHSEPQNLYFYNVIREAGFHALQRANLSAVSLSDVRAAMSAVQPTAMREIYVDIPKVSFCSGVANASVPA